MGYVLLFKTTTCSSIEVLKQVEWFPSAASSATLHLVKVFGNLLGDSQFRQSTAIAALKMNLSVLVTSYAVEERVLISPM